MRKLFWISLISFLQLIIGLYLSNYTENWCQNWNTKSKIGVFIWILLRKYRKNTIFDIFVRFKAWERKPPKKKLIRMIFGTFWIRIKIQIGPMVWVMTPKWHKKWRHLANFFDKFWDILLNYTSLKWILYYKRIHILAYFT